jgi:hypothetical protein
LRPQAENGREESVSGLCSLSTVCLITDKYYLQSILSNTVKKIGPGLEQFMQIKTILRFLGLWVLVRAVILVLEQFNRSWMQRLKLVLD